MPQCIEYMGDFMNCSITELCEKDVVEIKSGNMLGRVSDVEFCPEDGRITALIIYGRQKMFGLGKGEEDIKISWDNISVIGADTILVTCEVRHHCERPKNNPLKGIFNQ